MTGVGGEDRWLIAHRTGPLIGVVGVVLLGMVIVHLPPLLAAPDGGAILEVMLYGSTGIGILLTGIWLPSSDLDRDLHPRVLLWMLVIGGVLAAIIVAAELAEGTTAPLHLWLDWALLPFGIGATIGVPLGVSTVRAVTREREVAAERVSRRRAEEETERLDYINHLLRHDVINAMSVIMAQTTMLSDTRSEHDRRERLQAIEDRSEAVVDFVERVRTLVRAMTPETPLDAVDLGAVTEREVAALRLAYPAATVETDIDPGAVVRANELVTSVVTNVLENAIRHADHDAPTVTVCLSVDGDLVRLRVTDDGPGIPDDRKREVFEPTGRGDHGFGLYLTQALVDRYGGRVELEDATPRGTSVLVTFHRASQTAIPVQRA